MAAAPEGAIEFFHGYTYSGHPAACAAGLATLDIYRNEGLFERGARAVAVLPRRASGRSKDVPRRRRHSRLRDARGDRRAVRRRARTARSRCCRRSCSTTACISRRPATAAIIAPPLIAEKAHVDIIVDILRKTLATSSCTALREHCDRSNPTEESMKRLLAGLLSSRWRCWPRRCPRGRRRP